MVGRQTPKQLARLSWFGFKRLTLLLGVLVLISAVGISVLQAQGSQLKNRYLKLADPSAGATTSYVFGFQPTGLDTIQTIVLQLCSNDPFPGAPCTAPIGLDVSGATLINQSGDAGFSISAAQTTANELVLARPPLASNGNQDIYEFQGVVNPSTTGSYYVRIQAFPDNNLSGEANYYGGIAFAINNNLSIQATVPPYLLLCAAVTINGYNCDDVTGYYVNFGELNYTQANQGSTQLLAATNALNGYTIRAAGPTMTSGNNVITAMTSPDVSRPGTSQFGINLVANNSPQGGADPSGPGAGVAATGYNQANFYQFNSGDVIAQTVAPDLYKKYTVSYIVNVPKGQSPGVYVTTLSFIALGSF